MNNEYKNITEELEALAPSLLGIDKNQKPEVPAGYFDEVEDQIISQLKLTKWSDEHTSKVPEGYFDNLEDKIISQLPKETKVATLKPKTNVISIVRYASAAMVVFVLFFTGYKMILNTNNVTHTSAYLEVDEMGYYQYLENNIDDVDISQMIDYGLIEESDLSLVTFDSEAASFLDDDWIWSDSDIDF